MKVSTGLRNTLLATSNLKTALAGGEIRLYQGTVPTSADDVCATPTPVCVIKNAGAGINFDTAAVAGVLSKAPAETWSGVNAAAATVTYYRHVLAADTNNASTSALRLQGSIGLAGADMNLTSVGLANGATQALNFYSVSLPAGS